MADLAALLKERHGSDIHLYCTTAQEEQQYRTMDEANVFSSIMVTEHLMPWPLPGDLDPEAVISRAGALEQRYGVTFNYLMMTNRHHGRGFALGGFYHPRSRQSEEMDYIQTLHVYSEALEFWEREFSVKRISLQINGGTLDMIAARAQGMPVRSLTMARYKQNYTWLTDEFDHNAAIGEAFEKLGNRTPEHKDIELTLIHLTNRARVLARRSPFGLAKTLGHTTLRRAYHKLRGYKKACLSGLHPHPLGLEWRKPDIGERAMDVLDRADLPFPHSLPEFQRLFPDDAACAAYLEKARWGDGFACPHCGTAGEPFHFENRPGVLRCRKCRQNTGLTVGTVMERKPHSAERLVLGRLSGRQSDARHVRRAVSAATWSFALRDGLSNSPQAPLGHGAAQPRQDRWTAQEPC